jgi:hypothetical protein
MNHFLWLWSLISPGCVLLIGLVLWVTQYSWYPTQPAIGVSIGIYLAYWLLLAALQGLLLWRLSHQTLAYKWALTTGITGFVIMLAHELIVLAMGVDTRGQGVLFLLLSLPVLGVVGGFVLGLAQFLLLRTDRQQPRLQQPRLQQPRLQPPRLQPPWLQLAWFVACFLAWVIGFGGVFLSLSTPFLLVVFAGLGTAVKGLMLERYLKARRSSG